MRHDNHADINILRSMVLLVPQEAQTRFAANICGRRLMLPPIWLRVMHWTVCKFRGLNPTLVWYLLFDRVQRGLPEQVVLDFSGHICHGKDASDRRSVGGLNQEEVEATMHLLRQFLQGVEMPTVYKVSLWPTTTKDASHD